MATRPRWQPMDRAHPQAPSLQWCLPAPCPQGAPAPARPSQPHSCPSTPPQPAPHLPQRPHCPLQPLPRGAASSPGCLGPHQRLKQPLRPQSQPLLQRPRPKSRMWRISFLKKALTEASWMTQAPRGTRRKSEPRSCKTVTAMGRPQAGTRWWQVSRTMWMLKISHPAGRCCPQAPSPRTTSLLPVRRKHRRWQGPPRPLPRPPRSTLSQRPDGPPQRPRSYTGVRLPGRRSPADRVFPSPLPRAPLEGVSRGRMSRRLLQRVTPRGPSPPRCCPSSWTTLTSRATRTLSGER